MDVRSGTSRRQALRLVGAASAGALLPRPSRAQELRRFSVVHASGAPLLAWAPSFVAEDLGYYKEEGFAIDRVYNGSGPGALTALVSGSVAWLNAPPGELLTAGARGQKFKILAAHSDYQSIHLTVSKEYAAKNGITPDMTYDQKKALAGKLKGMRIGLTAPNSLTDLNARSSLKGLGLDYRTDAQLLPLGSVPNSIAALARGNIDAFAGASPAPEKSTFDIGSVIFLSNSKDEMPGLRALSGHLVVVRAADLERDPALYAAVVRADVRGMRYVLENPAAASEIVHKRYPAFGAELWADIWRLNVSQFRTPYVSRESVEAWITTGAVPGMTDPKAIDVGEIIDMRLVDQAVQKIGWKVPT